MGRRFRGIPVLPYVRQLYVFLGDRL